MTLARTARRTIVALSLSALPGIAIAQEKSIAIGADAPVVTIPTLDGDSVSLGQYIGKRPVLLEFWATWCKVCEALLPRLRAAHQEFGKDVEFIGINVAVNQKPDRVRRYVETEKPPFRTLFDTKGTAARPYGAQTTSYIVIIDRAGKIAYTGTGTEQHFEAALAKAAKP